MTRPARWRALHLAWHSTVGNARVSSVCGPRQKPKEQTTPRRLPVKMTYALTSHEISNLC